MYDREGIVAANRLWSSAHVRHYLGRPSRTACPGDVDPNKTLIIGQAEPDSPIALDYRVAPPRVVYLGDFEHEIYWLELALNQANSLG
jgi:hypothetical protein